MYIVEKTRSRDLMGNNLPVNENSNWEMLCTTEDQNKAFEIRAGLMEGTIDHYIRVRKMK